MRNKKKTSLMQFTDRAVGINDGVGFYLFNYYYLLNIFFNFFNFYF